jgi:WS/DGAT/MGAT family acyltransferase
MNTLSGLDASFLYLESPEMPMHVGSFCLYEMPASLKGNWHQAVYTHIAKRLHLASIFTHKLKFMPLDLGHPVWVEDKELDLKRHILRIKGKTLSLTEAQAVCAKLHSRLIDRRYPLWEFHVFERIKRADGSLCGGIYSKIHHAALDGKAGTILSNAILDISATPREVTAPLQAGQGQPHELKIGEMIGAVFSNSLAQYVKLVKALPQAAQALGGTLLKQSIDQTGQKTRAKSPLRLAPMTDFNVAVTSERSFGTFSASFAECRAMAKAVGGSLNDIVLWLCSTALRTYLRQHGTIPRKSLLAAMPVSLREDGNQNLNTQASMTVVELGTQFTSPMKRLQTIMASTARVKTAMVNIKGALPTDYPSLLAPWIVGGVAKAASRAYSAAGLSHRLPMLANLVISNVPGPQVPLYMAGARMLSFHPMSIVVHGVALNITVQTYAGSVEFGLIADQTAVPQLRELTDALALAFEEGRVLLMPVTPVAKVTPGRKSVSKLTIK